MLELTVDPPPNDALVSESLPVRVVVRNRGDAAVTLRGDPLSFVVRDARGEERVLRRLPHRLSPIETPARQPLFERIVPASGSVDLRGDVAEVAYETLRPGRYTCRARVLDVDSPEFVFTLRAPRPGMEASLSIQRSEGRAVAAWIEGSDVFVRETWGDPDRGVVVCALRDMPGLACVSATFASEGWFVALHRGGLGAGQCGPFLRAWLDGPKPEIEVVRILDGVFVPRDRFVFLLVSARSAQLLTLVTSEAGPSTKPKELVLGPILDLALPATARSFDLRGAPHAIWSEGSTLSVCALAADATPRVLLAAASPIRAFSCAHDGVDVLLDRAVVHVGFDGVVARETALPQVPAGVVEWAVHESTAVVRTEESILCARNGAWSKVVDAKGARHLAAIPAHWPRTWVEWVDPERGLVHAPVE